LRTEGVANGAGKSPFKFTGFRPRCADTETADTPRMASATAILFIGII
jgi:hypothetical protein